LSLQALIEQPFELLLELERRAKAAIAGQQGNDVATEEWVGIGFRLGAEKFATGRNEVREILPVPEQLTRVPGAKPWLRGIANIRGQLLTVIDLRSFLGAGRSQPDRHARILLAASREVPTALIVDEVLGFRRFSEDTYSDQPPATVIRCERYLKGAFRRGSEVWPRFSLFQLLDDEQFLNAGEPAKA
jgi:twitching motility protein PilI